jgi:hypothetical protein
MVEVLPDGKKGNKIRLHLHPGQLRAWNSKARIVAMIAGSQSGKTVLGPHWLYREIKRKGPGDYLIATPHFSLLNKKVLPEFLRIYRDTLHLGGDSKEDGYFAGRQMFVFSKYGQKCAHGDTSLTPTQVFFGHADNPDTLESMTAKGAWLDEAGQKDFKQESHEAIGRRLAISEGRQLITTTPYNLGWLYRTVYLPWKQMIDAGQKHPYIDCVRFESIENPAFPKDEYERLRATLPGWKFDLMHRGLFTRPAGMIYDCFDEQIHTCPRFKIPAKWQRYVGLDFGNVNLAAVFFAQEPGTDKLYAYREYKPGTKPVAEHVEAVLRGEPGIPYCVGGSASEDDWRSSFGSLGLPIREPDITGRDSVEVGIDRVYGALKRKEILFFKDLESTLGEFGSYSRVLDEKGEPTEEIDDKAAYHLLDAVRYIVGWLKRLGCGPIQSTGENNRTMMADVPEGVFGDWDSELHQGISTGEW